MADLLARFKMVDEMSDKLGALQRAAEHGSTVRAGRRGRKRRL